MKELKRIAIGFPFVVALALLLTTHISRMALLSLFVVLWVVLISWLIGSLVAYLWRKR